MESMESQLKESKNYTYRENGEKDGLRERASERNAPSTKTATRKMPTKYHS